MNQKYDHSTHCSCTELELMQKKGGWECKMSFPQKNQSIGLLIFLNYIIFKKFNNSKLKLNRWHWTLWPKFHCDTIINRNKSINILDEVKPLQWLKYLLNHLDQEVLETLKSITYRPISPQDAQKDVLPFSLLKNHQGLKWKREQAIALSPVWIFMRIWWWEISQLAVKR